MKSVFLYLFTPWATLSWSDRSLVTDTHKLEIIIDLARETSQPMSMQREWYHHHHHHHYHHHAGHQPSVAWWCQYNIQQSHLPWLASVCSSKSSQSRWSQSLQRTISSTKYLEILSQASPNIISWQLVSGEQKLFSFMTQNFQYYHF